MQRQSIYKNQIYNQQEDSFHQLMDKSEAWVGFVKFYFYDTTNKMVVRISEGTGFLNSRWTFITAYHNLQPISENIKCNHCSIYLRDPNENNKQISIRSRPAAQWFYNEKLDLALIKLESQAKHFENGVYYGDPADFQDCKSSQLYVTGFSNKMQKKPINQNVTKMPKIYKQKSTFDKFQQNKVLYTGNTLQGFSGCPILYIQRKKYQVKLKIIGMHLQRQSYFNNCVGLLFNETIINLIQCWMNNFHLQKNKIQNRLSLMMAYFLKICETTKQQILAQYQYPKRDTNKYFLLKTQPQASEKQQEIDKEHKKLLKQLIYEKQQQKICETIGNIYILEFDKLKKRQKQRIQKNITIKKKEKFEELNLEKKEKQQRQKQGLRQQVIINEFQSQHQQKKKQLSSDKCKAKQQSDQILLKNLQNKDNSQNNSEQSNLALLRQIKDRKLSSDKDQLDQSNFSPDCFSEIQKLPFSKSDSSGKQSASSLIPAIQKGKIKDKYNSIDKDKISNDKNQNSEILDSNIFNYPHNCIGWIMGYDEQINQLPIGTGFLISPYFILTAANNFLAYKDNKIKQLFPSSFTLLGKENKVNTWKSIKIRNHRISRQFIDYKEMIFDYFSQREQSTDCKFDKQIQAVKQQQSKFDFALLELVQPVLMSQYLELTCHNDVFTELTICGYTQNKDKFKQVSINACISKQIRQSKKCIYYNSDTKLAQNGSPVFAINKQVFKLVAIHGSSSLSDNASIGVLITNKVVEIIHQWKLQTTKSIMIV